ncbi:efflux RND transporter periplasmic adaptor subunit [Desulfofalx alkaliphila]|uniref:efflux RND transporter periplasmic adaptor subunit n=1 Tax=Desulfofalx alkaliphila TaxID=105483 RepID=UPI00068EC4B7|nr:efflux RND transporter periplasmic adaptor subunit [Desulfofalx alkaliphila]
MRKYFITLLAMVGMVVLLVGCGNGDNGNEVEEESSVPVNVVLASVEDLDQELELTGEVKPGNEITLAPKIAGRVAAVHATVGQTVSKGAVLIELEGTDIKNSLITAEAALEMQQIALEDAQRNYERMSLLNAEGAISQLEYEKAETQYKLAQAQLNQAKASLDIAKDNYKEITITSPMGGKVAFINAEVGEMVGPQVPVAGIVNLNTVIVKLNLSENLVGKIAVGQKVDVYINALGKTVEGKIKSIAPQADNMTRAFPVEIEIPNADGDILAGMVAKLQLSVGQAKDTVVVPTEAVLEHNGQHRVFVVEDDLAQLREVKVGISNQEKTQILSGIEPNEQVITAGNRLVGDGQKVTIVKTTGEAGGDK